MAPEGSEKGFVTFDLGTEEETTGGLASRAQCSPVTTPPGNDICVAVN